MLIFATSAGTSLGNWDRETKALQEASGTEGWTRHDLRRTGATMLGEMGELPDIIEAALNHVSIRSPLAATYNRSRYRPQVAAALQRLADALDHGAEERPMSFSLPGFCGASPPSTLARYFVARRIPLPENLKWDAHPRALAMMLLDAIEALNRTDYDQVIADFERVDQLCNLIGQQALLSLVARVIR